MSAGKFSNSFYALSTENGGAVVRARVQPETIAATIGGAANVGAAGPATAPGSAVISRGRQSRGVNMRYATLKWTAGAPTNYDGLTVKIPVLTPTTFASWTLGATGTYLGSAVEVVGRNSETVR